MINSVQRNKKTGHICILVRRKCILVIRIFLLAKDYAITLKGGDKMKIKAEQDLSCNEIEIIIKYPQKDKQVDRIIDFLQSFDMQIKCAGENADRMIDILDIYYIESVDKKTFVYLENAVYRTDFRLYQLKNKLQTYGFVQISKSCILNINALDSIRPLFNSRMEATLKNGEKVNINRNYLNGVKKALGGEE